MAELGSIDDVGPGDFHAVKRIGVGIGFQTADFIQGGESGDHYAKDGVLSVLGWDRLEADIKLASIRLPVWIDDCPSTGPSRRHRENVSSEFRPATCNRDRQSRPRCGRSSC